MLWQINKLANIAAKPERMVLGLMSGTSLDGLDIALCCIKNSGFHSQINVLAYETMPYDGDTQKRIRAVFAKPVVELKALCSLNVTLANTHAALILDFIEKHEVAKEDIDLIASHGQTVFHHPLRVNPLHENDKGETSSTLQIVDGDHIAHKTGIITISDFRQKHVAAGGEGAPLATYGDYLLFKHDLEDRVFLNLGGIANITYVPANARFSDVISTDTGPANTLLDAYVKKHFDLQYDKGGHIAESGRVDDKLLQKLLSHPFFDLCFPKTTGPEEFSLNWLEQIIATLPHDKPSTNDVVATLVELTALSVANAVSSQTNASSATVFASGGGIHNAVLMARLKTHIAPIGLASIDDLGIQADAKEAVLFALLANECISGDSATFASADKSQPNVSLGKISLPF